ncbi:hypothetical protein H3S90_07100 [Bartonella sp. W8097]|nr:hypothetical protein [Bartonella apihabitans]
MIARRQVENGRGKMQAEKPDCRRKKDRGRIREGVPLAGTIIKLGEKGGDALLCKTNKSIEA